MYSEVAISVDNLSKCYEIYEKPGDRLKQMFFGSAQQYFREFWALKNVSFSINRGETVGIIGRNGSGKSTLLQMICGTVTPTSGSVKTNGRIAALLELGAGFNSEFTGRENVLLNAAILGFPQSQMAEKMEEVLAFSELGEFLDQPVKTYSSGMYSRLAFSIAIHVDPDILIVDEALAVGDARFVAKCMRKIKEIQQKGTTILFVSHDVGSIRTLCDRAIWLEKGVLQEQGDVFPVSGRFMEFMFKDELSQEDCEKGEILQQLQEIPDIAQNKNVMRDIDASLEISVVPDDVKNGLDSRPVTHWGSHKGLILSAQICDEEHVRKDVHSWGAPCRIVVNVSIPLSISREHLSIAVSIKDLKGTDLIVSTTHDFENIQLPQSEKFSVSFDFINSLVTGKYLLVAAVENRQHRDIHYYEYVEGAHYFSSLSNQRFFGLFQPTIKQHVYY